jgi:hypothetical protein
MSLGVLCPFTAVWVKSFFFFGIEYHFVREIKFHRELSTLENSVP